MLRIGLTQRVEIIADRGERRDCLDQAWSRLLLDCGYWPVPLPNLVENVAHCVADFGLDGIILTGGNDLVGLPGAIHVAPERDAFERKLLNHCGDEGIPVLGVCRGLQMMVMHYGGQLVPVADHVATSHEIAVADGCLRDFAVDKCVNSFHRFGVHPDGLGPVLRMVACAPDGSVEALVHQSLPQWGIMWHPERSPQGVRDMELLDALFAQGVR